MAKNQETIQELLATFPEIDTSLVNGIRSFILAASPRLVEGIKWKAPSYSLDGNDIITFNFRNYLGISLIFHTGPKGKDTHTGVKAFTDFSESITWVADKRFVVKIPDHQWLVNNAKVLKSLIDLWTNLADNHFGS